MGKIRIIGEKINTSRAAIAPAVRERNQDLLQEIARRQVAAGAWMLDVNCGTLGADEPAALTWLVETVQAAVDVPLCLDSPNPAALASALPRHRGKALLNSITGEEKRFREMAPLAQEYGAAVVALCMDDRGIPETASGRVEVAARLFERLTGMGIPPEDIYFDPLVRPVGTESQAGIAVLETLRQLRHSFPEAHTLCGLSNVSFGLPQRRLLNQAFLVMCLAAGLDSVILDPEDRRLMGLLYASEALLGQDEYCLRYITAAREGKLKLQS